MAPGAPDQPWIPETTATGEIVPGSNSVTLPSSPGKHFVLPPNTEAARLSDPQPIDGKHAYTLPELVDIAEKSNPTTKIAWNAARNVALAKGIAESTFLPRLTASAITGRQSIDGGNSVDGFNLGNQNTTLNGTISAVSMEWLLFDFGERAAIVRAADQASVISNVAFTAAHQQVIYEVSTAFYAYAASRERLKTAIQSLRNAQSVQAAAEDRYRHGIGTVVESSQALQATAQARLVQVQADGSAKDGYLKLISAMGISPLTRIRIADISNRRLSPPMYGPIKQTVEMAIARRPDILSAYAAQKAALANIDAARAAFMPKVFLAGNAAHATGDLNVTAIPSVGQQLPTVNISGGQNSGTILAGVTVPLFDGGTRLAALKQAEANAENAGLALLKTQNEAVRQIVLSDNALRTSLSAYTASVALNAAAQTTFNAALDAYRNGVGSITNATLSQSQLLLANNARADAYSTSLSAAATLALAVGALGDAPR
ncbi:MAG: TolC family protein [Bradyrhizobium sp.]